MPPLDLEWLADFVLIAEGKSISVVAGIRGLKQSTLSRRMQQLEHWAGAELLVRSFTGPPSLTRAGEKLLPLARNIIQATNDAFIQTRKS